MTIGFQKKLNNFLDENDGIFTLIIYLAIFIIISFLINFFFSYDSEILNNIFGLVGIACITPFLSVIISSISYFGNKTLKDFSYKYLEIIPITFTKFYNILLMKNLANILDKHNIDILSNSTVSSLFLILYKIISYVIKEVANEKQLILFQFIFGIISLFPLVCSSVNFLNFCMKKYKYTLH